MPTSAHPSSAAVARRPRLRALGDLTVAGVPLSHRKGLVLLAFLALEGRQPRARLARLFWPDSRDARNRLSVTLSRLRAVLPGAIDADERSVATPLRTDVDLVERALDRGRVERALRLVRGPFLAGTDDGAWGEELGEWIVHRREGLSRALQGACLARATAEAAAGRFDAAVVLAAAAHRTAGTTLLEPEELARLHALLLAGGSHLAATVAQEARALGVALAADPAGARAALGAGPRDARPHPRPRPPATSFVGREAERLDLIRALEGSGRRLITLVGPGGIGKTRLAAHVAADLQARGAFPGGVWSVALADVGEAEAPDAIAEALGRPRPSGVDADRHLAHAIGPAATLLVLDDVEHLPGLAPRVARWLAACPGLTVLATARQPLDLACEWVVPVPGLGVPPAATAGVPATAWPAVALFEARARQVDPAFRVRPDDAPHVVAIARTTGGNPLALELAAGWVATMTPADLAAEVARDRDVLRTTQPDRAERHRSLRAVFDHTWRLLTPEDRTCLAALAVVSGGFDRTAAHAVAGADAGTLARLVARSLLVRRDDGTFVHHPLLHPYVRERLDHRAAAHASAPEAATALARYEEALAVATRQGDRRTACDLLGRLGLAALTLGDRDRARRAIRESAAMVRALGATDAIPTALDHLACLAADVGEGARAARLWGTASGLRAVLDLPDPVDAAGPLGPFRAAACRQVGGRAFEAAWTAARDRSRAELLSAFDAELAASPTARARTRRASARPVRRRRRRAARSAPPS